MSKFLRSFILRALPTSVLSINKVQSYLLCVSLSRALASNHVHMVIPLLNIHFGLLYSTFIAFIAEFSTKYKNGKIFLY